MSPIKFEKVNSDEIWNDYFELASTFQQELGITYEKAAIAVSIVLGVCSSCLKQPSGCYCMKDE